MTTAHRPLLVTHSGTFHLDDAFAYAALRVAFGLREAGGDHALVRTRDELTIAEADVAWDVGAVYDPAAGRFDHHQRGAPERDDGLPYSAAGLVWRHHGEAAVRALLGASGADDLAAAAAAEIDREVVRRIDAIDNGVGPPGDALGMASLVEDCNPPWDSPTVGDRAAEDAAFLRAAELSEGFLRRRAEAVRARLAAEAVVLSAHARSADPRILELDRKLPWEGPVHAHGLPVLYAVYPVPERQLDGRRHAAGAGLLRSAPPVAGSMGGLARRRPRRGLRRPRRGVRPRAPLRGRGALARGSDGDGAQSDRDRVEGRADACRLSGGAGGVNGRWATAPSQGTRCPPPRSRSGRGTTPWPRRTGRPPGRRPAHLPAACPTPPPAAAAPRCPLSRQRPGAEPTRRLARPLLSTLAPLTSPAARQPKGPAERTGRGVGGGADRAGLAHRAAASSGSIAPRSSSRASVHAASASAIASGSAGSSCRGRAAVTRAAPSSTDQPPGSCARAANAASPPARPRPRARRRRGRRAAAAGRLLPTRCRRRESAAPKRRTIPPLRPARRAAGGRRGRGSSPARDRRVGGPSLARMARSSGATASSTRPNVAVMRASAARKRSATARSCKSAIFVIPLRLSVGTPFARCRPRGWR